MPQTTRELPVVLTESELIQKGDELAKKLAELADTEAAKKSSTAAYASRIGAIKADLFDLRRIVEDRSEDRPVAVTEARDFQRSIVETIRLDTNAVVDWRPMTAEELQMELLATGDDAPAAKARKRAKDPA